MHRDWSWNFLPMLAVELAGHTTQKWWSCKELVVTCIAPSHVEKIIHKLRKMGESFKTISLQGVEGSYGRGPSRPGKLRKVVQDQSLQQTRNSSRSEEIVIEEDLYLEGVGYVTAILLRDCLTWHLTELDDELVGSSCWGRRDTEKTLGQVLISEVYASEICEEGSHSPISICGLISTPVAQMSRFAVHTFRRSKSNKCKWIPKAYIFCHEDADTCRIWVEHLQGLLDHDVHRPRNLLVLVNPYGGRGSGIQQWESVAPLFHRARVQTKVILTERAGHAHDLMANTSEEDLNKQDGVIVVGGDGLFNEVLNGLVLHRHEGHAAPKPQRVAEILAKKSRVDKKTCNDGTKEQEGFCSPPAMEMNDYPPSGGSFDVHSPLLESLPSPSVDTLRPLSSSSACSSSSSTVDKPCESRMQQRPVNTARWHSAPGKEIELSTVDAVDFLPGRTASVTETLTCEEGKFLFPIEAEGVVTSSGDTGDGAGLSRLTGLVRHKSLGRMNVQLRIGIIPAGSTDTVAISTTGSRDPTTAALHILLGDSAPLDIVRITSWKRAPESEDEQPQVRYAASFAGYGFYGDVMKESETTRWMGPARYDIAGFKVFMKHKRYEAEVSFLDIPPTVASSNGNEDASQGKIICQTNCPVCAHSTDLNHLVSNCSEGEDDAGLLQPPKAKWRTTRDTFHSIGAAVISCRNEKAPEGLAAHAHLADGLLHLILIRRCSRPNYLRQLISLTRRGADPLDFNFVEHYKTPVFTFISHGEESVWNVDGELLPAHQLSAQCFRGLINVFARGPEV